MKILKVALSTIIITLSFTNAQTNLQSQCPMLYCDDYLGPNVCFLHSGSNPVSFIRFKACEDSSKICYMGDNYAWLDAERQFYSSGKYSENSQVYYKNTKGYCRSPTDFKQNLLPGRNCTYNTQCLSGICNSAGVCSGKSINEPCSSTSECDVNMGCIPQKSWPFQTICTTLLYKNDNCTDDYQCDYDMICGYLNSNNSYNDIKHCIPKFQYSDGVAIGFKSVYDDVQQDSLRYGLACSSGICREVNATACKCFSIANVTSDYGLQTESTYYKCSAMSKANYCQYYYTHDDDSDGSLNLGLISMRCQCSLDGSVGYCPMPGQYFLNQQIAVIKQIDTYASGCHSMDRENMNAQMECGIGRQYSNPNDLNTLLENKFKFEYWPYAQYQNQKGTIHPCLNKGFQFSPRNIIKLAEIQQGNFTTSYS